MFNVTYSECSQSPSDGESLLKPIKCLPWLFDLLIPSFTHFRIPKSLVNSRGMVSIDWDQILKMNWKIVHSKSVPKPL